MYSSQKSNQQPQSLAASDAGASSASAPWRGAEGAVFGAYVLGACIEQGPMGRVFRAEHQGLGRHVALKILDAGYSASIDLKRFIEQARTISSVKHPAIVNVFDAGFHEGVAYVVTDLVEGVSLRDFIAKRGPLDEATVVDIAVPLVSALVALHDAGLVHDDLNPARVYLSEVGAGQIRARMVDVTHSRLWRASRSTSGVSAVASPVYMAPEVVLGGVEGPLTDQYGVGVLMYECATGVNPFALEDARAALQRITTGGAEPLSSRKSVLSKRLIALIERAMHVDPARRFANMRELGHELSATAGRRTRITWGLGSREVGAEHGGANLPSRPDPLPSLRRSRRRGVRVLAWAALALLAGLALKSFDAIPGLARESTRDATALTPSRDIKRTEPRPAPPAAATARSEVASPEPAAEVTGEPAVTALPGDLAGADESSRMLPPPRAVIVPARASMNREDRMTSRRPKPVRPAASEPAAATASPDWMTTPERVTQPDWMITPNGSARQPGFERGTNQALILD